VLSGIKTRVTRGPSNNAKLRFPPSACYLLTSVVSSDVERVSAPNRMKPWPLFFSLAWFVLFCSLSIRNWSNIHILLKWRVGQHKNITPPNILLQSLNYPFFGGFLFQFRAAWMSQTRISEIPSYVGSVIRWLRPAPTRSLFEVTKKKGHSNKVTFRSQRSWESAHFPCQQ